MEDDLKIKKQIEGSNQSPKRCLHAENQVLELKNKKVMSKGVDRCVTGHPLWLGFGLEFHNLYDAVYTPGGM